MVRLATSASTSRSLHPMEVSKVRKKADKLQQEPSDKRTDDADDDGDQRNWNDF